MEMVAKTVSEFVAPVAQMILDCLAIFADKALQCVTDLADKGKQLLARLSDTSFKEKIRPYAKTIMIISCTIAVISALCLILGRKK